MGALRRCKAAVQLVAGNVKRVPYSRVVKGAREGPRRRKERTKEAIYVYRQVGVRVARSEPQRQALASPYKQELNSLNLLKLPILQFFHGEHSRFHARRRTEFSIQSLTLSHDSLRTRLSSLAHHTLETSMPEISDSTRGYM